MKQPLIHPLIVLFAYSFNAQAGHALGGEITYRNIGGYQYEIQITTYTSTVSPADRPVLDSVHYGDGTNDSFVRDTFYLIGNNVKVNMYKHQHIYPSQGVYKISFEDPNRIVSIKNIVSSVNIPFYVTSEIVVFDPVYCPNNSITFGDIPIIFAQAGKEYKQNVIAIDPDQDSLSYELVACGGTSGLPVSGYYLPPGFSINSFNGEIKWIPNSDPDSIGVYQFAVKVIEWRYGKLVGYVIKDFPIIVNNPTDTTYSFNGISSWQTDASGNYLDTLTIGDTLNLSLAYDDVNATNIDLNVFSETFLFPDSPLVSLTPSTTSVSGTLQWTPDTMKPRLHPYIFVFRGTSSTNFIQYDLTYSVFVSGNTHDSCPSFPDIASSVTDLLNSNNGFIIFPNPTSNYLMYSFLKPFRYARLKLYNLQGKEVGSWQLENNNGKKEIDVSELSNGIYFYSLIKDGVTTDAKGKVVVMH